MRNHPIKKHRYFVQSLFKELSVLQTFSKAVCPLTLFEITHAFGANNSTTTRCCYNLTEMRLVGVTQRRYHSSPKVLTLGYGFIAGADWQSVAEYHLRAPYRENSRVGCGYYSMQLKVTNNV